MFDNDCSLTGIPLYGEVSFVLLIEAEGVFRPCSLPVRGERDPYDGAFKAEERNLNAVSIWRGISSAVTERIIVLDGALYGDTTIEPNAGGLERLSVAMYSDVLEERRLVHCNGRRLTYALIEGFVFNAIEAHVRKRATDCSVSSVLGTDEPASSMYARDSDLAREAGMFRDVCRWLATNEYAWQPVDRGTQYDESTALERWRWSLNKFKHDPVLLAGLRAYGKSWGY